MGSALSVVFFLIGGIVKKVFERFRTLLEVRMGKPAASVGVAVFGGTLYGIFM